MTSTPMLPTRPQTNSSRTINTSTQGSTLADILERVLDKGIVIAGDISISIASTELVHIRIRLLISSVDKAKEMGINWWYFPYDSIWLTHRAFMDEDEIDDLDELSLPSYIKRKFTLKYEEDSEINNWLYSLQRMVQFTEEELNAAIDDFAEFVTETRENNDDGAYNRFVNQYFMTLDVYGLGVAGLELLNYTRKLVPDAFYHSARTFFLGLASFHPMRRPLIQTVLTDYEQILETTGMLKFDQTTFKFKDHVLVSVPKHQNFMIQSAHDAKESPRIADRTLEHMIEMDPIPSKKSKSATPVSPTLVPMLKPPSPKTPSPKPSSPKSFFVARRTRKLHYKIPARIRKRRKTAKNI